ncbi:MAG: hypothetical protein IPJ28_12015 [Betaproteobacteria bacterium]|nr:hypothetical protein [Betaproteobacteria bacterium]
MRTLFAAPTVAQLAEAIRAEVSAAHGPRRKPLGRLAARDEAPMSVMQERLRFPEELSPELASRTTRLPRIA